MRIRDYSCFSMIWGMLNRFILCSLHSLFLSVFSDIFLTNVQIKWRHTLNLLVCFFFFFNGVIDEVFVGCSFKLPVMLWFFFLSICSDETSFHGHTKRNKFKLYTTWLRAHCMVCYFTHSFFFSLLQFNVFR